MTDEREPSEQEAAEIETTQDVDETEADQDAGTDDATPDDDAQDDDSGADDEGSDDDTGNDEDEEKPKRLTSSQRKARKIAAQAEELDAKSRQIAELERRLEAASTPPEATEKPKEADFESWDDWQSALQEWNTRKVIREETTSARKQDTEAELKRARDERAATLKRQFQEREATALKSGTMPDYREQVDRMFDQLERYKVAVPPHVGELIQRSEAGPAILYSMSKDPEFLEKMVRSDSLSAALEIGRREARLLEVKPRTQSKAAPPLKPPKGGGNAGSRDPNEMSVKELAKRFGYK